MIKVERLLDDPYLRRSLHPTHFFSIRERARIAMGALSPVELADGAGQLIRAMNQDTNPDAREASEIRTTAVTLLDLMVAWGINKGIDPSVYKNLLVRAFTEQYDKLISLRIDALMLSGEAARKRNNKQGIHDNIRTLLQAADIVMGYLGKSDCEAVQTELRRLGKTIEDRELVQAISERVAAITVSVAETTVQPQKGQIDESSVLKNMQKLKKTEQDELDEFREEVLRFYNEGKTACKIAHLTNRSERVVYRAIEWHRKKRNIKETKIERQRREAREWKKIAREGFREGKSNVEIAKALPKRLRRTPTSISAYRKEWREQEALEGTAGSVSSLL